MFAEVCPFALRLIHVGFDEHPLETMRDSPTPPYSALRIQLIRLKLCPAIQRLVSRSITEEDL